MAALLGQASQLLYLVSCSSVLLVALLWRWCALLVLLIVTAAHPLHCYHRLFSLLSPSALLVFAAMCESLGMHALVLACVPWRGISGVRPSACLGNGGV